MAHTRITADQLVGASRADLDAMFSSSTGCQIPSGRGAGTVIFLPNSAFTRIVAHACRLLLWKGKVFGPRPDTLVNMLGPFGTPAIRAAVYTGSSRLDGKDAVILDYSRTSIVAHWIHDEIREVAPHLYLGLAYLAGRRLLFFVLDFSGTSDG